MLINIILGYGIFTSKDKIYKDYLDTYLDAISKNIPDIIITTGGISNPRYPDLSEAKSMGKYLLSRNNTLKDKLFYEERSLSTNENLLYTKELLDQQGVNPNKIIIFCDSIRVVKVYYMACHIFNESLFLSMDDTKIYKHILELHETNKLNLLKNIIIKQRNLSIQGINMHRTPENIAKQISGTLAEIAIFNITELQDDAKKLRKKKFGLI
jgi:hypothetical protein